MFLVVIFNLCVLGLKSSLLLCLGLKNLNLNLKQTRKCKILKNIKDLLKSLLEKFTIYKI